MTTGNDLLLAAAGQAGVSLTEIGNSALFDSANDEYLTITAKNGNPDIWTFSTWVNRAETGVLHHLIGRDITNQTHVRFDDNDKLMLQVYSGGYRCNLKTNMLFRDLGAWYHIVAVYNSSPSTPGSTDCQLWVNGVQITDFATETYPSQNDNSFFNDSSHTPMYVGTGVTPGSYDMNGYMAETVFIDGTQYAASSFGEFDSTGLYWTPKSSDDIKALTFGTNGFYLDNTTTPDTLTAFTDSGPNTHTVTARNNTVHSVIQSKIGNTSASFDGTNDYLEVADHADFEFGTGNFTMEAYVLWTSTSASSSIFAKDDNGSNRSFALNWHNAGHWDINMSSNGSSMAENAFSASWTPTTNTWYHIAITRSGTDVKMWIDGTQSGSTLTLGTDLYNGTATFTIGSTDAELNDHSGYIDEIRISDIARYTGSFTPSTTAFSSDANTMLLVHSDASTGVGDDASGNFNTFQNNNTVVTSAHTPSNSFVLLNPLEYRAAVGPALTNGNRSIATGASGGKVCTLAIPSSGKWKVEWTIVDATNPADFDFGITGHNGTGSMDTTPNIRNLGTAIRQNGSEVQTGLTDFSNGDIVTVLVNVDGGSLQYKVNNSNHGSAVSFTYADYPAMRFQFYNGETTGYITLNNGDGGFTYTDADYNALNTQNITSSTTRTVSDVYEHWNNVLYTGDGNNGHAITGAGLAPDFVWLESRSSSAQDNHIHDVVRSVDETIKPNASEGASTDANFDSLDSDGFTLSGNTGGSGINSSGVTFVAWCAKLGGSAVSNTSGSITSSVSVNTTLGMSVGTYVGNATAGATIGHGLGVTPEFIIVKSLASGPGWYVFHPEVTTSKYVRLEGTAAAQSDTGAWNAGTIGSSTFEIGGGSSYINDSGVTHLFIAFAPSEFISIGSYEGNGSASGTLIPTINSAGVQLQPIWMMIKSIDSTSAWHIYDAAREGYNVDNDRLEANSTAVEGTADEIDIVSGGIKNRIATDPNVAETYIYIAIGIPIIDTDGRLLGAR
jgi:hypothetical protein